jgi:hypothetical protein
MFTHLCISVTSECSQIFQLVNDWVGLLEPRNKPVEDLRAQIKQMNQEAQAITDPVEQNAKFAQIQEVDECLDLLYDTNQDMKKELREFKPVVQETYVQIQQLDYVVDSKWKTLMATKPIEPDVAMTQEFVIGASILVRKWKDKVEQYDNLSPSSSANCT